MDDHIDLHPGRIFMNVFNAKIIYLKSQGQVEWEGQGWCVIELVSQKVQMPCGWLLNQDQMGNSICWILVILQLYNAPKSDEKWRYVCHSEILASLASCLDIHHRRPVLKQDL